MSDYQTVSLETIKGGAALEMFNNELPRVIENILDPNTQISGQREIHLVVKFVPSKDERTRVSYEIECYSKLAKNMPTGNTIYVGMEVGELVAYEQDIKQPSLPFGQGDNVKPLKERERS